MSQNERAARFAALHIQGNPLVLYNVWDAGSAKAVIEAGAAAIATSSWSIAEAQGYRDGEEIPIEIMMQVVGRITATVEVPVSVDFEGGYSPGDLDDLAANISRLIELGAVGINFEDRVVNGSGLYGIERQVDRIATIRQAADDEGVALFINARTDLFLGRGDDPDASIDAALDRASAYCFAGASGFFVPGLQEEALIARICEDTTLPVNVMVMDGAPSNAALAAIGVSRISYGPIPFIETMNTLQLHATKVHP
jgi:2-methylisocitrate lyase-like PEP mutase family enzyme